MDNKQFIDMIKLFQENDFVHELTCICGAGALDPIEKEGEVILYCKTCGYEQKIDDQLKAIIVEMHMYDPFGLKRGK